MPVFRLWTPQDTGRDDNAHQSGVAIIMSKKGRHLGNYK